jgi:hypothetical protein
MAAERKPSKRMPDREQEPVEEGVLLWKPRPHLGVEDDQPLDEKDQPILEYQPDLRNVLFSPPPTTGWH